MGTAEEMREIRKLLDEIEPVESSKRAEWSKTFGFAKRSEKASESQPEIQKDGWGGAFGLPDVSVYDE